MKIISCIAKQFPTCARIKSMNLRFFFSLHVKTFVDRKQADNCLILTVLDLDLKRKLLDRFTIIVSFNYKNYCFNSLKNQCCTKEAYLRAEAF